MTAEEQIVRDVKEYGWHIINVFDNDGRDFSYSIGLYKTFNSPELFMSGIDGEIAYQILNNIATEISEGKLVQAGELSSDVLEGYECFFGSVENSYYSKYFGKAQWFYSGDDFPVIQCVWPNKSHEFPWETEMEFNQDILFSEKQK